MVQINEKSGADWESAHHWPGMAQSLALFQSREPFRICKVHADNMESQSNISRNEGNWKNRPKSKISVEVMINPDFFKILISCKNVFNYMAQSDKKNTF